MDTSYFCAIFWTLFISNDVVCSTIISGQMTQESHPMLASLFNVANKVGRLHPNSWKHKANGQGIPRKEKHIGTLPLDHGIKRQDEIVKFVTHSIPVQGKTTETLHRVDVKPTKIPYIGQDIIRNQDILKVTEVQPGIEENQNTLTPITSLDLGGKIFPEPFAIREKGDFNMNEGLSYTGISADVLCSLCRRQENITCISLYCWNVKGSNIASESQHLPFMPLLPHPAHTVDPILPNNFDFSSQIDRHDLLQLTNPNSAPSQNNEQRKIEINNANLPAQTPSNTRRENTAPIWILSDNLQNAHPTSSTPQRTSPLWSIADNVNSIPESFTDKTVDFGLTGSHTPGHGAPVIDKRPSDHQHPMREIAFIDVNLDPIIPGARPTPVVSDQSLPVLDSITPTINNEIHYPLDVSTDVIQQLLQMESQSFAGTSDTTLNAINPVNAQIGNTGQDTSFVGSGHLNENGVSAVLTNGMSHSPVASDVLSSVNQGQGQGLAFPTGFAEGSLRVRGPNTNSVMNIPQIPTANDVFSTVRNNKDTDTRHTLVIKDHGTTEVVGVHVGNGPILRSGVRPLEVSGQNAVPHHPASNIPANSHTLEVSADSHSHHTSHDHHTPIVGKNNMPMNTVRHVEAKDNVHHDHGIVVPTFSTTTTPVPTINPVRRAALQNWSNDLLQGMNA